MGGPWAIRRRLSLAIMGKRWEDALGVGATWLEVWRGFEVAKGSQSIWRRWLVHTLAATPEPHDPRGFLTGCSGDRRHNHGAWGLKWLAVPGSCFGV